MSLDQISALKNVLLSNEHVKKCVCDPAEGCIERGKITCLDPDLEFMHIRFDDCMCRDSKQKRCDCIIFCFDRNKRKQGMFVIEVKDKYNKPSISEVNEKIQRCINAMGDILKGYMSIVETIPILCDEKHPAFHKQVVMALPKVSCYGSKRRVILIQYERNIVRYYRLK